MLDAGGGGGYAGRTNWNNLDVEAMWSALANQDTNAHWKRVTSWQKTYELSSTHLWRLKQYRERLTEAWPPEKNEAARAYVERLDHLILTVQGIYDAAVDNYETVKNVALAIGDAKPKLKKIYDDYVAKKAAKKEYEERVEAERKSLLPGTTLGDPPATQADLDRLNNQARSIMFSLSNELGLAQMQIRKPPEYKPSKTKRSGGDDEGPSGSGGGFSEPPPVLPPVVAVPPGGGGGGNYTPPPPPGQLPQITPPIAPGPGPILGGANPPVVTPPPPSTTPPPVITPPTGPTPTPTPLPPAPFPPSTLPPGTHPNLPASQSPIVGNPATGPKAPGPFGGPKTPGPVGLPRTVMPPGGMIGGHPPAGLSPSTGAPARRINPVGGLIGGGGAGTGPLGNAGSRPGQPFGVPGMRSGSRRKDEENHKQWDPDNPWETDEGVDPVVGPPREVGRIDPGPAIGFDR